MCQYNWSTWPPPDFRAKLYKFYILKLTTGQIKFFTSGNIEEFGHLTSYPVRFDSWPGTSGQNYFNDAYSDSAIVASFHKSLVYYKFNPSLIFFSLQKVRKRWGECNFIRLYLKRVLCTFIILLKQYFKKQLPAKVAMQKSAILFRICTRQFLTQCSFH